jgi:ethanolamine ammonia-lyase large subunit
MALADIPLRQFLNEVVMPYEADEVTRLILDSHDAGAFGTISHLTVGGFRDWLLSDVVAGEVLVAVASGLTPEMVAAVSKLCRLQDRYRSGRRIATALAESAVNSLVARRMVKKQQMQWSKRGAHLLLQVRAAVLNGDLRERLTYEPPKPAHRSRIAWMFEPTPPLLEIA